MKIIFASLVATALLFGDINISPAQMSKLGITTTAPKPATTDAIGPLVGSVDFDEAHSKSYFLDHEASVATLNKRAGDSVKKGDVLATISSAKLVADSIELKSLQEQYKLAAVHAKKDEALFNDGVISQREMQLSQLNAQTLSLKISTLKSQLALSGINSKMALVASRNGIVSMAPKNAGEKIVPFTPYFRISSSGSMLVHINIPPSLLASVKKGDSITLEDGKKIGSIISISWGINQNTNSAMATAKATTTTLLAGSTANFFITSAHTKKAYILPTSSVVRQGGKNICFIRSASGFKVREILLLSQTQNGAVVSGVMPSDAVVSTGIIALKGALNGLGFE